ncbi:MAG: GGDEF domain-containing protein, partial [Pseudomonadota bacterium]
RYAVRDLIEAEEDKCTLYDLAMTDPLTTALNRRAFFRFSEKEVRRANRHGLELSVLMLDIDHFKQVNDVHGHNAGDEVLKKLIQTLVKGVREEDLIGRLGGEEFALVLPETGPATAAMLANRLRHDVKKLQFLSPAGPFNITISVGVSEPFDGDTNIQHALERADKALYEAKKNGRDRVELAPSVWDEKAQA